MGPATGSPRHDSYQTWLKTPNSSLLWICGEPATGKTYLSIFLTRELEIHNKDQCLAFYFCSRQDQRRNTALTIIRGLMHFLLEAQPELINGMLADFHRLKKHRSLFDMSNREALWRNLEQMLRTTSLQIVYFVLDALDECEESSLAWVLPKLTHLTEEGSGFLTLKIIITSRQIPAVLHEFLYRFPRILVSHSSNLEKDLNLYVSSKIKELAEKKSSVEDDADQRALVREKWLAATKPLMSLPNENFLWVSFAVRDLEKAYLCEIEQKLQSLPRDLDGYYAQMLCQISRLGEGQAAVAARVIRWVVMALRPLSLLELSIATETPPTKELSREEAMADRLRLCGYFLKVNNGIVSPIHKSARDFLTGMGQHCASEHLLRIFRIQEPEAHLSIAQTCLQYIQGNGITEGPFDDGFVVRLESHQTNPKCNKTNEFPFLQYAALNWPKHAKRSSRPEAVFDISTPFFHSGSYKQRAWLHSYWHVTMPDWPLPDTSFDLLHLAAYFGLPTIAERILTGSRPLQDQFRDRVNCKCNLSMAPLHWAVRNGHEDTTKVLLEYGANKSKGYGLPAMVWAVRNGHGGIIRLLWDHGFDVDATGYGMTGLQWAVWEEREEMVRLLLILGASLTQRTTSLKFKGASCEVDNREFPWTTVDEANYIFRITESEERISPEKEFIGMFAILSVSCLVIAIFYLWKIWELSTASALVQVVYSAIPVQFILMALFFMVTMGQRAGRSFVLSSLFIYGLPALLILFKTWCDGKLAPPESSTTMAPISYIRLISFLIVIWTDFCLSTFARRVERRWVDVLKAIPLPFVGVLSTINHLTWATTGYYLLFSDSYPSLSLWCILGIFYLSIMYLMAFGKFQLLGKTAGELAVSKGAVKIIRLLEEAAEKGLQDDD